MANRKRDKVISIRLTKKELKTIGNNLNQITRKINSYEIQDCSPYLNLIYKQISELMKNWQ